MNKSRNVKLTLSKSKAIQQHESEGSLQENNLNQLLQEFRRRQAAQDRRDRRHLNRYVDVYELSAARYESLEEDVIRELENHILWSAVMKLGEVQRRRLLAYYVTEFTLEQVAENEGVSRTAVAKSIKIALNSLKQDLDNQFS